MWTRDYELTAPVDADALWRVLSDVNGWVAWNAGIERIELDGPVAVGSTFRMTPPGEETLTSTIVALEPGRVITDETAVDGLVIRVVHRLDATADDATTITYRIEVTGPAADAVGEEVGTAISADFPDVMAALAAMAASAAGEAAPVVTTSVDATD